MILASLIFLLTLIGLITRPFGLGFGSVALIGAGVSLVFGLIDWIDIYHITTIVWDATFTLIGLIILSLTLEAIGFFEAIALWIAKHNTSSPKKLFVLILIFGALLSILCANDGAVLILTPIVFALMQYFQAPKPLLLAFVLGSGFIVDTASNALVTSNLTNILTAGFFKIGFIDYMQMMFVPNLIAIIVSILVLYVYFYPALNTPLIPHALKAPKDAITSMGLFIFAWVFLGLLALGLFWGDMYHLPISIFVLGGAIIFLAIAQKYHNISAKKILKHAPWQVVGLSVGLYVIVYGLKNAGLIDYLNDILVYLASKGKEISHLGVGILSAILSALMNNMPTNFIQNIALKDTGLSHLAYSNIIGSNIGTKFTPIGSLATLLWLHILGNKGLKISWLQYCKMGLILTPPVLLATLLTQMWWA
ncbi:arsenic transporter [Helicobacter sp. 12S02634-8]|uniref:arsenical efflux pump membrane protein ArsB n=1 Tax=Helicobacter sp. 12S02634-8 TaxID=1476199 RepID=UPI000BA6AB65|nr:arsenical efflux pump membrane protein ArsB [Helicobacter sp. 12S02634-8]PAF46388.1 arsenic transporter [Helicobacter sp. 12S02634-8]